MPSEMKLIPDEGAAKLYTPDGTYVDKDSAKRYKMGFKDIVMRHLVSNENKKSK